MFELIVCNCRTFYSKEQYNVRCGIKYATNWSEKSFAIDTSVSDLSEILKTRNFNDAIKKFIKLSSDILSKMGNAI